MQGPEARTHQARCPHAVGTPICSADGVNEAQAPGAPALLTVRARRKIFNISVALRESDGNYGLICELWPLLLQQVLRTAEDLTAAANTPS